MVRILIAATPDGAVTLERILQGYECSLVTTLMAAEKQLNADAFDLIVASLHFDHSQMFAFISEVKKSQKNSDKPIICFCARDTPMSRLTLDTVIGGGLWKGSMTLLSGGTGTGKTTMALQFALEGVRQGVRSLYVNLQENPAQLARSVRNLTGHKLKESGLDMLYISPVEVQIDSIIVTLFRMIQEKNIGRVVVDSIGDLAMAASDPQRLHDYLYALVQHFALKGITAMFTLETGDAITGASTDSPLGRISYMSDNIFMLALKQEPEPRRELKCVKTRGSKQDLSAHEFVIETDGLHVS